MIKVNINNFNKLKVGMKVKVKCSSYQFPDAVYSGEIIGKTDNFITCYGVPIKETMGGCMRYGEPIPHKFTVNRASLTPKGGAVLIAYKKEEEVAA